MPVNSDEITFFTFPFSFSKMFGYLALAASLLLIVLRT